MSRVTLLERLYKKPEKSALDFDYDALWAPPILSLLSQSDINELYQIATSVKLSGNINKKYRLIDAVMGRRGFRFDHRGTNRATYRFLEDPRFLAKVALDRVGIKDSPAEFENQNYFKPFCCKIFEVDPTGVIAFVEKVNPITSLEEFASVSDDIFNMMATKIIGKYVVDDLGTSKYMNYGIRIFNGCAFGPVIIDFPYAYELDGAKLICTKPTPTGGICGGEIDYDAGFNNLICIKCGKRYSAKELKKDSATAIRMFKDTDRRHIMRVQLIDKNGNIITDSGITSDRPLSKEEFESMKTIDYDDNDGEYVVVNNTVHHRSKHREPVAQTVQRVYEEQFRKRWAEENNTDEPLNTYPMSESNDEVDDGIEIVASTVYHGNGYDNEEDYTSYYDEPTNREEVLIEREYDNTEAIEESIPELKNPPIEETLQEELVEEEVENIEEDSDDETDEDVPEIDYGISAELEASIDTAVSAIIEKRVTLNVDDEDEEEVIEEDDVEEPKEEESEVEEESAPEEPIKETYLKKNPTSYGPQIITPTTHNNNQEQPVIFKRKDPVLTYNMQQQLSNAMMASKDEEPDYSGYEPEEEPNSTEAQYDNTTEYDDSEEPTYEKVSNKTKFKPDMSDY